MISESQIESTINGFSSEGFEQIVEHNLPPDIRDYLLIETINNLLEDERSLFYFCLATLTECLPAAFPQTELELDKLISMEEDNWSKRDKYRSWEDSLNAYFDNYPEEDLLAFVEDMLVDDDDQQLSTAGKEIIFISCKSLIDCYITS